MKIIYQLAILIHWKQSLTNGLQNSLLIKLQAEKFPKYHKEISVPQSRF